MKKRYSGFLLMLTLMFAVILGFIPGVETAMTVHAEEESEVSEELYATEESITASGTCGKNLTWTLENGTLTISGTGKMSTFDYSSSPWYEYSDEIKSVVINEGVETIGEYAFNNCWYINTVKLPTSLQYIYRWAFRSCINLSEITIPNSVVKIDSGVFSDCTSLSKIIIPSSVAAISSSTFSGCTSLSEITIPNSVVEIGVQAFWGCTSLSEITIPSSVIKIGHDAFEDCTSLSGIIIPNSVKEIESGVFSGCTSLSEITIPDGVVKIGSFAFEDCMSLSEITIPNSVEGIGSFAFSNCTSLSEITIPSNVKAIDSGVFSGCTNLSEITIPNDVIKIGSWAFSDCTSLSEITIPSSVKTIDSGVFSGCTSLSEIIIPKGCTAIASSTFSGCENLSKMPIPDSVTSIGGDAFKDCLSLEKITIPSAVTQIGTGAFSGCSKLNTIIFKGAAPIISKPYSEYYHGGSSGGGGYYYYEGAFADITANVYYPQSNNTWTKEVLETNYGGKITWIGYESTLATPSKPYKIANVVNGVHVYWNAVDGATKYGLWRSETGADGSYKWVGNPTTNHFTDTKVESGKTYYYSVTACNPKTNVHTLKSEPIGVTYVGTPDITDRMNLAAGVKLTWNKISGATGYAIYRKPYTGNAAWVRVTTISGNETFTWTDKSVASANGTLYRYTIRALAGTNMKTLSGCRNTGRTMARLTSRTMNSVTKTAATSVKCTWTTTAQASGYEVRFMNGNTVVKQFTVGNYKTGAKTFTGIPAGANYKVQVRSYKKVDGVGVFYSAWSTPKYVNL